MNNNRRFDKKQNTGGKNQGKRSFDRPTMHKTTCNDCGSQCEVPFKPTGNKPVLCSNCFRGKNNDRPNRFNNDREYSYKKTDRYPKRPQFEDKNTQEPAYNNGISTEQFEQLNNKMDLIIESLISISAKITSNEKEAPAKKDTVKKDAAKKEIAQKKEPTKKTPTKKATTKKAVTKKTVTKKAATPKKTTKKKTTAKK